MCPKLLQWKYLSLVNNTNLFFDFVFIYNCIIVVLLFLDGVNEVKATMTLIVRLVTDEMLFNSVTVRLADMTKEAFLSPLLEFFTSGLAAIIPCPKENIFIFSVQDDSDVDGRVLNVSFSAKQPDGVFYTPQFIQERVYLNRGILTRLSTLQVGLFTKLCFTLFLIDNYLLLFNN